MGETQEFQERVGRIDALVHKLESAADPALRATARELVQALMEFHGAGIRRILEIVYDSGATGTTIIESLGRDELVSSVLVLYDLHPDDFGTRVHRALDKARPILRLEGARLEVIAITESTVHVRIDGDPGAELHSVVREALLETAPDATHVTIEGGREKAVSAGFVPLTALTADAGRA